jgi:hypothetical protein
VACTGADFSTIERVATDLGDGSSITILPSGLPFISYHDSTASALKVASCQNILCSTSITRTLPLAFPVGRDTALMTDFNGRPQMTVYNTSTTSFYLLTCADLTCAGTVNATPLDTAANSGASSAIVLGEDGYPLIAYLTGTGMRIAHCSSAGCSSAGVSTIAYLNIGRYPSIAVDPQGLPVIVVHSLSSSGVLFIRCNDAACSSPGTLRNLVTTGLATGGSVTIGADGLPLISYYDLGNGTLRVIHCGSPSCQANRQRR